MPIFELLSKQDAKLALMTGKRAEQLKEYVGYINRRQSDQVGKLTAGEDETTAAIRPATWGGRGASWEDP